MTHDGTRAAGTLCPVERAPVPVMLRLRAPAPPGEAAADAPAAVASPSSTVAVQRGLAVYVATRVALLLTAVAIASVDHLRLNIVLPSWDAKHYLYVARYGYPRTSVLSLAKPDAFFPLFPVSVRILHTLTGLPWLVLGVAVCMLGGAALVVLGAKLAESVWGPRRAGQAAVVLAAFPGSFVAGMPYADPIGLAFGAGALLLLERRRYLLAGLAAMAATLTFSLALSALLAVAAWALVARREPRALLTGAFAAAGAGVYLLYLWIHVGTPFIWSRLEAVKWHSHFGLSIHRGTLWALQSNWHAGSVVATCLVFAVVSLAVLLRSGAPSTWMVFSSVIFLVSLFDTGTWLTPRLLYAMFPAVLAMGSRLPERWTTPVVVLSTLAMCLCLCIYAPQNWVFFNP